MLLWFYAVFLFLYSNFRLVSLPTVGKKIVWVILSDISLPIFPSIIDIYFYANSTYWSLYQLIFYSGIYVYVCGCTPLHTPVPVAKKTKKTGVILYFPGNQRALKMLFYVLFLTITKGKKLLWNQRGRARNQVLLEISRWLRVPRFLDLISPRTVQTLKLITHNLLYIKLF